MSIVATDNLSPDNTAVDQDTLTQPESSTPARTRWKPLLCSGLTVFGVACAAAYTSRQVTDKDVGITAWVAVAVVGAATMIATAKHTGRKP
jgi:hypothetical protein